MKHMTLKSSVLMAATLIATTLLSQISQARAIGPAIICNDNHVTLALRDFAKETGPNGNYAKANLIITVGTKTSNAISVIGLSEIQPVLPAAMYSSLDGNTSVQLISLAQGQMTANIYSKDLALNLEGLECKKFGATVVRPGHL